MKSKVNNILTWSISIGICFGIISLVIGIMQLKMHGFIGILLVASLMGSINIGFIISGIRHDESAYINWGNKSLEYTKNKIDTAGAITQNIIILIICIAFYCMGIIKGI